jgi:glyoxylase-like metal-dependent hydrolase (beta-lactamase superfamily II)
LNSWKRKRKNIRVVKTIVTLAASLGILSGCNDVADRANDQQSSYTGAADLETFCDRLPRAAYARFEKHDASNDWFEVYEVAPGVWAIYEPFQWQEVISYLIVGTDSAVLFDTGNGISPIKPIVDQLTNKPIRILNSHSHFDHIGGNYEFDDILSVGTQFSLARARGSRSEQISMEVSPEALCKDPPAGVTQENHQVRPFPISGTIGDGTVLDIGGRRLEVLGVPGHTDDAIALLDRSAGLLWSGDSFYEGPIWLFFPETDLVAYRRSVARLASLAPDLSAVFPAHNTPKANPALLVELEASLDRVLAGEVTPTPVSDGNVEFRFDDFSFLMRGNYYRIDSE